MKKISIVIPVYNIENYIGKCLESVVQQDYQNVEIIVVNDGSTDSSLKICQDYANNNSNIKILNCQNDGLGSARNKGIDCASGDYITFIDGDDFVDPNYVSSLVRQQEKYQSDISVTFNKEYSQSTKQFYVMLDPAPGNTDYDGVYQPQEWLTTFFQSNSPVSNCAWMKLYDKKLFKNVRFPENHTVIEDAFTFYKLVLLSERVSFENIPTYIYRTNRADSITGQSKNSQFDYCEDRILNERIATMSTAGLDTKYMQGKYRQSLSDLYDTSLNNDDDETSDLMSYKMAIIDKYRREQ